MSLSLALGIFIGAIAAGAIYGFIVIMILERIERNTRPPKPDIK